MAPKRRSTSAGRAKAAERREVVLGLPPPSREMSNEEIASTQREPFLAAYECRRRPDSIFSLGRQLGIPRQVIIRWLLDPDFQARLQAADSWRVPVIRDIFNREIQGVVENLFEVAKDRGPGHVQAGLALLEYVMGQRAGGEHKLQAIIAQQVNFLTGDAPTADQLTQLLKAKRKHDRIIAQHLKRGERKSDEIPPPA